MYEILQLQSTATQDEIKKQFRMLSLQHHPDKGGDPQKYQEMVNAYSVLGDPEKRMIYDKYGDTGLPLQYIRGLKYMTLGLLGILILLITQLLLWDQGNWFLVFIPTYIIYLILVIILCDGLFHKKMDSEEFEDIEPKDVRLMSGAMLFALLIIVTVTILILVKLQLEPNWLLELILIPYWAIELFILLQHILSFFNKNLESQTPKFDVFVKVVGLLIYFCRVSFMILLCIRQHFVFSWIYVFIPLLLSPCLRLVVPLYWCKVAKSNISSQLSEFFFSFLLLLQVVLFYLSTDGIIETRHAFIPLLIFLFILLFVVFLFGIGLLMSLKKEEVPRKPITDPARMIASK